MKSNYQIDMQEQEENDWRKAEDLVKSGGREEVEVVSSSTRGFTVRA